MPTLKNPVTGQTVSVAEGQEGAYTASGWTPTTTSTPTDFNSITADSLKPEKSIDLPTQQPDTNNYQGIISGGQALSASLKTSTPKESTQSTADDLFAKYIGSETAPSSLSDTYTTLYGESGIDTKESDLIEKQKITKSAQSELELLNAQMKSLEAESKAVPIQIQEEFAGRGATAGGVAPHETARLRNIALRSLPLEGQILAAQAKVASAQGDESTSLQILELAQQKFDKVFELKSKDIENQYNYKKDQQDKIYEYLNDKEKKQLDEIKKEDDRKYQETQDNKSLAQSLVAEAIKVGAADIASALTQLDPADVNFTSKLADLQSKIIAKQNQTNIQSTQDELARTGYTYVSTPAERDKLKAQGYDILVQSGRTYAKAPKAVKASNGNTTKSESQGKSGWTQATAETFYKKYIDGGYSPAEAANRVAELSGFKPKQAEFDMSRQFIADNPNADPNELKSYLQQNTSLTDSEINAMLPKVKSNSSSDEIDFNKL